MLKLTGWTKDQASRLNHIRRNRLKRGLDPMAPLALDGFNVPTSGGREFLAFAHAVGGRQAETMRHRVWEYVALHAAQTGEILVTRSEFGRVVLSRSYDPIGRTLGERVYDALVESGLASTVGDVTKAPPVTSPRRARDVTNGVPVTSPGQSRDVTGPDPVTSPTQPGDVTNPAAVTSPGGSREPARAASRAHAQPTRSAGAANARARTGEAVSSLNGTSRDVTSDVTGDAPDQTGNQRIYEGSRPSTVRGPHGTTVGRDGPGAAARPGVGQTWTPEAWLEAQVEPTRRNLRAFGETLTAEQVADLLRELDGIRRSASPLSGAANALLLGSGRRRDPCWLRSAQETVQRVREGRDGPTDQERDDAHRAQLRGLLRQVSERRVGQPSERARWLIEHGVRDLSAHDWRAHALEVLRQAAAVAPAPETAGSVA